MLREPLYVYLSAGHTITTSEADNAPHVIHLDALDFNPPGGTHMTWHADTWEVEFLADGIAQAQVQVQFAVQADGGAGVMMFGFNDLDGNGDPTPGFLYIDKVPLTIGLDPTGNGSDHVSLAATAMGATIAHEVEAGDRWKLGAMIGGTAGPVSVLYADLGVYWTNAGYAE